MPGKYLRGLELHSAGCAVEKLVELLAEVELANEKDVWNDLVSCGLCPLKS